MIDAKVREEVTTVNTQSPQQVVKKTIIEPQPAVKGEPPQKVYDKKKTIVRFNQVIWYILGVIEVLLTFRFVLKLLAANSTIGFTSLIYTITNPIASPFAGILGLSVTGGSVIEWSTIVAGIVYLCVAWGLVYLLDLVYPITPEDVEAQ